MQWRADIGNFYRYAYPLISIKKNLSFNVDVSSINEFFLLFNSWNFIMLHGDIETNPGPNKKYKPVTGM